MTLDQEKRTFRLQKVEHAVCLVVLTLIQVWAVVIIQPAENRDAIQKLCEDRRVFNKSCHVLHNGFRHCVHHWTQASGTGLGGLYIYAVACCLFCMFISGCVPNHMLAHGHPNLHETQGYHGYQKWHSVWGLFSDVPLTTMEVHHQLPHWSWFFSYNSMS